MLGRCLRKASYFSAKVKSMICPLFVSKHQGNNNNNNNNSNISNNNITQLTILITIAVVVFISVHTRIFYAFNPRISEEKASMIDRTGRRNNLSSKKAFSTHRVPNPKLSAYAVSYSTRYLRNKTATGLKYDMASLATGGFFQDICNEDWELKMFLHCRESVRDLQEGKVITNKNAKVFYIKDNWKNFIAANYEPTFTCQFEEKLGSRVDGAKWTCDPHRIIGRSCLVYSFGSNNQFDYEEAIIKNLNSSCIIHTFDPSVDGSTKPPIDNIAFHRIGISDTVNVSPTLSLYDIGTILDNLGHSNVTIDLFKIDCEGCEFYVFTKEFFRMLRERNVVLRQIAMEIHPSLIPREFDESVGLIRSMFHLLFDEGYVIYHKEPNTISHNTGQFVEYGFLLIEGTRTLDCS